MIQKSNGVIKYFYKMIGWILILLTLTACSSDSDAGEDTPAVQQVENQEESAKSSLDAERETVQK